MFSGPSAAFLVAHPFTAVGLCVRVSIAPQRVISRNGNGIGNRLRMNYRGMSFDYAIATYCHAIQCVILHMKWSEPRLVLSGMGGSLSVEAPLLRRHFLGELHTIHAFCKRIRLICCCLWHYSVCYMSQRIHRCELLPIVGIKLA
jgi:hypothetical protein